MKSKYIQYIFIVLVLIICIYVAIYINNSYSYREYFNKNIIGYIHVCQKGEWQKSYDLLLEYIKKYGLYDNIKELRIGVVNDMGDLIEDRRFTDKKIKIIYVGKSDKYERPTLLHMKKSSELDCPDTLYFYLHTKGISHFNTEFEKPVLVWIKDMLYWNIQLWENVIDILENYSTYGCNYNGIHYSGNFWWSTLKHIQSLPNEIPDYYTAPEDWVTKNKDNIYCANNCENNYKNPYPDNLYI